MAKRTDIKNKSEWLNQPWTKLIGVITGATLLIGTGYSLGLYKQGIESNLEQIKIRQEFNEKLLKEISDCQKEKLERYELTVNDIKTIVETLNRRQNERKK